MNDEREIGRHREPPGEREIERDSQLSAMFDGELSAGECELIARRLSRDEALRSQWSRFSMIGAAIRAERGVDPYLGKLASDGQPAAGTGKP